MAALPAEAVPLSATEHEVLSAVLAGCRTGTEVALMVGRSRSTTHHVLRRLQALDLVDWQVGRRGTLRPLVRPYSVESGERG